jgi:uncharacterized membrane protein
MENRLIYAVTLYATLGVGLMAGVFFAFSTAVMGALDKMPAPQSIAAMQHMNKVIVNPLFMLVFMGTTVSCAVLGAWALFKLDGSVRVLILLGCALYLVGAFLLTGGYHIPKNDALDKVNPQSADAVKIWADFMRQWVPWNNVRALASLGSLASFAVALKIA